MAKKKQTELTIEEKLQNALVPKEEQPYKIPNNWCWTRWGNLSDRIQYGVNTPAINEGNARLVRISDIQDNKIIWDKVPYCNIDDKLIEQYLIKENDILFARTGGTVGKSVMAIDVIPNAVFAGYLIRSNYSKKLNGKYLKYFMESNLYWTQLKIGTTATAQPNCNGKTLAKMIFPLPPINEQQRIVNIIESLFTKLDKAKELIENTLAKFEQNKMAILHKAFTGELTAKWRKENNIDDIKEASNIEKIPYIVPSGWYWDKLKNVTVRIVDGDHNPPAKEKEKTNYIMLSAQNIGYSGFINMDKVRYLSKDNFDKCHKRTCLEDEDILFSSVGSIGNAMVYREKENDKITFQRSVTIIKTKTNPYYLRYVLLSPYCQQIFKTESIGTAQKGFYIKQMKNLIVPVPTIEEQQEIVKVLDKLLAKYNKIKDLEKQLEQIELLKKAILAKAFRGELGTNNPDEESAEVLLKEILAEK